MPFCNSSASALLIYIKPLICNALKLHLFSINTLRPRQNGRHFADNIFKYISLNENVWIPNKISLKFVPRGPINNIPELVQIMAWRRPGDKPLSEAMLLSLPKYIYVTWPQWVKPSISAMHIIVILHKLFLHQSETLCQHFVASIYIMSNYKMFIFGGNLYCGVILLKTLLYLLNILLWKVIDSLAWILKFGHDIITLAYF